MRHFHFRHYYYLLFSLLFAIDYFHYFADDAFHTLSVRAAAPLMLLTPPFSERDICHYIAIAAPLLMPYRRC
jgi:hypothetical protein